MMKSLRVLFPLLVALFCLTAQAEELTARCIAVSSGTTCTLTQPDRTLLSTQLWGVSKVEEDNLIQIKARRRLSALVQDKAVTVEMVSRDASGNAFAKLCVGDTYVNAALVREGLLRLNPEQAGNDEALQQAEAEARAAGKGYWSLPGTAAAAATSPATPAEEGPTGSQKVTVTRVIDGDTLAVVTEDGTVTRVCLYGCDAPEKGQELDEESREALSAHLEGKSVHLLFDAKDERERTTARVYANGVYVNRRMLEQGYAMVPPSCRDDELKQVESKANHAKVGMWLKAARVAPWAYRQIAAGRRADAQRRLLEQQLREEEARKREKLYDSFDYTPSSGGTIHVRGYYRKDGTYVRPHTRRR